jgi:hypothetical protein
MPVFGKSLFETVLEGVHQDAAEEDEDITPSRVRGFNTSFVGRDYWGDRPGASSDPSTLFDGFPPEQAIPKIEIPDWAGRLTETEIAEDLALKHCRTEQDLRDRRRVFALANHPDRMPVDYRDQATRRMMIANQLIDVALGKFH